MNISPESLDDVVKSTCVVIVFAYLITFRRWQSVGWLGFFLGTVGLLELWVSREQSPYDTYTLIITISSLRFGPRIGAIAALWVATGAAFFLHDEALQRTYMATLISLSAGLFVRRTILHRGGHFACISAIVMAEVGAIGVRMLLHSNEEIGLSLPVIVFKVITNGLGGVILQMVLTDADARHNAETLRLEVERGRTRLAESQFMALQARVHPHFLFNSLTSIAALCRVNPMKAEQAIVQLGKLMRRALDGTPTMLIRLSEELESVEAYLTLESLRMGTRLHVVKEIMERIPNVLIPPFALQTIIENAILHGIGTRSEAGILRVNIRSCENGVRILVVDSGTGIDGQKLKAIRHDLTKADVPLAHGLRLANERLVVLLGQKSRLRLFSRPGRGTLVTFFLPSGSTE